MKTTVTGFIRALILTSLIGVHLISLVSASFQYNIISPENTVYPVNEVPLNISIRTTNGFRFGYSNYVNKIFYCLDGQTNVTIPFTVSQTGDQDIQHYNYKALTFLTGLSEGDHSVIVYAVGNIFPFVVDTLDFAVGFSAKTPNPNPSSTPTLLPPIRFYNPYLILFGSTLLLVGLGILAYFKKFRK